MLTSATAAAMTTVKGRCLGPSGQVTGALVKSRWPHTGDLSHRPGFGAFNGRLVTSPSTPDHVVGVRDWARSPRSPLSCIFCPRTSCLVFLSPEAKVSMILFVDLTRAMATTYVFHGTGRMIVLSLAVYFDWVGKH